MKKKKGLCYLNCTVQMVFSTLHAPLVVAVSCLWLLWQDTLTSQQFHHCLGPNELWIKKLGWAERPQLGEISHTQQASPTYINRADQGKKGRKTKYWDLEGSAWGLQSPVTTWYVPTGSNPIAENPWVSLKRWLLNVSAKHSSAFWYHKIFFHSLKLFLNT